MNRQKCYCGNSYGTYGPSTSVLDCIARCGGNSSETCGGYSRLTDTVYSGMILLKRNLI